MSKQLPTKNIANELAGSSVFFQSPAQPKPAPKSPRVDNKPTSASQNPEETPSSNPSLSQSSNQDSTLSRNHAITHSSHQDDKQPVNQDGVMVEHLDEIRKAVKQLGKELSTHRFTLEEKAALADIVYTYSRQGVRTSENEITRIGVNWLLVDYQQNGANSVLARLIERLHS